MIIAGWMLALACGLQVQDEKKPPPPPPVQKEPQDQKKPTPEAPKETIEPAPEESGADLSAGLRVGGWWLPGFDAVIAAGRRKIESTLLVDAGVDVEANFDGWTLAAGADYGAGDHVKVVSGSIRIGARWAVDDKVSPLTLGVSAGPLFGRLDTTVSGFGDFKSGVGFEGRIDAAARLTPNLDLGLWADYRYLKFEFEETVLSGDRDAGGSMFAVGAALIMRF
jgi:hypothetical protein